MSAFVRQIAGPAVALLFSACCCLIGEVAYAESNSPDVVRRYEFGSIGISLRYGYDVLDAALERSVGRYGSYRVEPVLTELSVARLHKEAVKGEMINVVVSAAIRREMDEELIPIHVALDKGLNGFRVAIIRASDQERLAALVDIGGLRQMRIGIGEQWNDVPIYQHNYIPLVAAKDYESLLSMLERERFDLFPRPATGVLSEYNAYKNQHPDLVIEQRLLIHYPLGMYAFVSKSTPRLAERIRYGLEEMKKDGTFDKYFEKYFGEIAADLHLSTRTIIELENPFLPAWVTPSSLERR